MDFDGLDETMTDLQQYQWMHDRFPPQRLKKDNDHNNQHNPKNDKEMMTLLMTITKHIEPERFPYTTVT